LYYLGEYLHLFFFSLITATLFFGGWELPNFVLVFFQPLYIFDLQSFLDQAQPPYIGTHEYWIKKALVCPNFNNPKIPYLTTRLVS
jgi:hypothetical protein